MAKRNISGLLSNYLSRSGGFMEGSIDFTQNAFSIGRNIADQWRDGSVSHPWYGLDFPHTSSMLGIFLSSYYGLTFKTSYGKAKIDENGNLLITGKVTENWGG